MAFGISAATWAMVGAGALAYGTIQANNNAKQANELNKQAMDQATVNANKQQTLQEQAFNKANAKSPDVAAILSQQSTSARGGQSGTMLTGPAGIDPTSLSLSKSTLLGG
jgi:hypothetical protein